MEKREKDYSKFFINKRNKEEILRLYNDVIKIGIDFKLSKNRKEVIDYKNQEEIMKNFLKEIPKEGKPLKEVLEEFKEKILDGSVNFSSPHFLAFPDCGNSIAAVTGHILLGMMNQNLINSIHTSPTATFVEMECVNWLREVVGYSTINNPKTILDVGGISVTGGTMANTVGLLLARENKFPNSINTGLKCESSKLKVFIPKGIGHYSIKAGLGWLGLGTRNVVEVETTKCFTLNQEDLVKRIEEQKKKGNVPICIVAYTGDSRTMAIDDFPSLSKIAKKNKMWFHIDACHGLSLCFSEKMKQRVHGIELADSVTIDPHKVLFTPYTLSFLLVKNPKKFKLIAGVSDLITKENFSFGQITPFLGSRAFNSLKLWFLIKHLGKENIGKLMELRYEMIKKFSKMIEMEEEFALLNEPTINSSVYIYLPRKLKEGLESKNKESIKKTINILNKLNKNIQFRMFKEGNFYVHTFLLNDFKNVLGTGTETKIQMQRVMLGNPLTTEKDLRELIEYAKRIGKDEWRKLKYE